MARALHKKVAADLQGLVEKVARLGPSSLTETFTCGHLPESACQAGNIPE